MRIGLDLDGVLYNFDKTAQYMISRHVGNELREDMPWDHSEYWRGVSRDDWRWLWLPENVDPLFRHGHLYRGAIEFAQDLSAWGDVCIVSKRPANAFRVTWEWLLYHWGGPSEWPFSEVHILDKGGKSQVPVDIAIDDNPEVLLEWTKDSGRGLLMDRPWNGDVAYDAQRVRSFQDVLREVELTWAMTASV